MYEYSYSVHIIHLYQTNIVSKYNTVLIEKEVIKLTG